MTTTPFQIASEKLKAFGLVPQQAPGHYRVNYRNGTRETEYQTEDLDDVLRRATEMATKPPPEKEPPLGPTGPRSRRRAFIYSHNKRVAARRSRRGSAKGQA